MPGWRRGSRCCGHASYGIRCETGYGVATTRCQEPTTGFARSRARRDAGMVRHAGSRGFTLLEMLLVIVIFGFLLTLVAPKIDLQKFTVDSAMQSAGTTLLVAQRLAVTRQHNIIVAFDVPAEAMRILDDANNNGQADPGEHLRVVPLAEHIVYGQGGAPPLGTWAGPISFTKTFATLPAVTFHRDGSASEAGAVYLTTARAAAGPGPARAPPR